MPGVFASTAEAIRSQTPGGRLSAPLYGVGVAVYATVAATITWQALAFFATSLPSPLPSLEAVLGPLCHHLAERTLGIGGRALPVCARCTGLWMGWLLACPLWLLGPPAKLRRLSSFALAATFLAGAGIALLEAAAVLSLGNLARAVAGVPLGLFAGWLLLAGGLKPRLRGTDEPTR